MEKSENTGLFSDFFYQLCFRPAVHQYRSSGLVSRRSAGGKEIFMNIVGVFDFSRSVRTADHPRVWQHGGANETLDSRSASRCPLYPGHAVSTSNPFPHQLTPHFPPGTFPFWEIHPHSINTPFPQHFPSGTHPFWEIFFNLPSIYKIRRLWYIL